MLPALFELELDRCGWRTAERHFENACRAVIAHDDAAYEREMMAFRKIKSQWSKGAPAQQSVGE